MTRSLQDTVVCITGASRGLGASLAKAFDARGARLVLAARTADQLVEVAASCRDAATFPCDVRDPERVAALVAFAVERFGRLDVMVNNAGLAVYGPVLDSTPDDVDRMIDTNVKGVIYGSQAALRVMEDQQSGLIVNVSSIAGKLHLPNEAVYNASKWAVNGFTGTLRLEANRFGVKVTCACPGGIDTPFWDGMERYPFPTDKIEPGRDFMSPDEVAESIVQVAETSDRYVVPEIVMLPMIR